MSGGRRPPKMPPSGAHRRHKRFSPQRSVLIHMLLILMCLAVFAGLVVVPCFYWLMLYSRVRGGAMPNIFVQISIALIWFFLCYSLVQMVFGIFRRKFKRKVLQPLTVFEDVLEAMDRIASGDFNVYVEDEEGFAGNPLVRKVNKLAADLSSLEQMRQEFVSNVSHEIQSPLTSIRGFATLLKNENLSPEQRLHYLEVIEAESTRLSKLSENLLKLSMLDADQPALSKQNFRLDKQLQSTLLMLEPQWSEKQIELDLDLQPMEYHGDQDLFSQVWINLLHNAIKFTEEGGQISVKLTQVGAQVVCEVADNGVGMAEDELPHIFERFYKVDKARDRSLGGNGLGLALVKRIVELHQGRVTVQSTQGEGTAFLVTLPILYHDPPPETEGEATAAEVTVTESGATEAGVTVES